MNVVAPNSHRDNRKDEPFAVITGFVILASLTVFFAVIFIILPIYYAVFSDSLYFSELPPFLFLGAVLTIPIGLGAYRLWKKIKAKSWQKSAAQIQAEAAYESQLKQEQHEGALKRQEAESKRIKEEREERENLEKIKQEAIERERLVFLERNNDLVAKFLEITERKVSVIDDYGDENWDALTKEIFICIKKISERERINIIHQGRRGSPYIQHEYNWLPEKLKDAFIKFHETQKSKPAISENLNELTGTAFEAWIVKLLKENGLDDVCGTPATGDQGADLIAKKDEKTIIIQAKRYQGAVGNKAVQEVISAVAYYGGDEGWVITNSTFTPSAKALANKSNIKLIDGKALEHIKDYI